MGSPRNENLFRPVQDLHTGLDGRKNATVGGNRKKGKGGGSSLAKLLIPLSRKLRVEAKRRGDNG